MRPYLVCLVVFAFFLSATCLSTDVKAEKKQAPSPKSDKENPQRPVPVLSDDGYRNSSVGLLRQNAYDHVALQGEKATDHIVLQGEKATDAGGGSAAEHLAPIILMVIAFLLAFIAACFWWNRVVLRNERLGSSALVSTTFWPTLLTMGIVSAVLTVSAGLLLANIGYYISSTHHDGPREQYPFLAHFVRSHHLVEMVFSFLSFAILTGLLILLWLKVKVRKRLKYIISIILVAVCLFFLCVVLLRLFHNFHRQFWLGFVLCVAFGVGISYLVAATIGWRVKLTRLVLLLIIGCVVGYFIYQLHHDEERYWWSAVVGYWLLLFFITFVACFIIWQWRFINDTNNDPDPFLLTTYFGASGLQLAVIIILLNIFPNRNFRLCNDTCVMLGSEAGVEFDLPCADNVAFMALHYAGNVTPESYRSGFAGMQQLPYFRDYASAIAMHEPIFPRYRNDAAKIESEPVNIRLYEDEDNLIGRCRLFIYDAQFSEDELKDPTFSYEKAVNRDLRLVARWRRQGRSLFRKDGTSDTPTGEAPVNDISFEHTFRGDPGKITFITYKFEFEYLNEGQVITPPDSARITFVLQDYHEILPDYPAPVYVQGRMEDVMDLLFIPAYGSDLEAPMDVQFINDFHKSARSIIQNVMFEEPSIKFWHKQFNFWVNKYPGHVADASCDDCCHVPPENFDDDGDTIYIPRDMEFKALLHKEVQWDFTDHCERMFSAEMDLVSDYDERSSFLHELGHAAFGLSDEYEGGLNYEATEHLPNVWRTRQRARKTAEFRHKDKDDVKRLE